MAIVGAGPYGLSLAAHLGARGVEHRIFGRPMQFWSRIAQAGGERYLKSYCFGTSLSAPKPGYSLTDYNKPRGLETFEPCSMANFADYGAWFQRNNVPWCEPVDVARVERAADGFAVELAGGERLLADEVVVATGLSGFAHTPRSLAPLRAGLAAHTSAIASFAAYRGQSVAVIGGGQSALEAAALLREAGARPELLVRESRILWHARVPEHGRGLWRRLRSPASGLGFGPKAWALSNFPAAVHHMPEPLRTRFIKGHLPPEGAWWLRDRVENRMPVHLGTSVAGAREEGGGVALRVRDSSGLRDIRVDRVIAGSGYDIRVDRLEFLEAGLRAAVERIEGSPRLNGSFESSVAGLRFLGPLSVMSFGPLFRFVAGAEYSGARVAGHLAARAPAAALAWKAPSAT